MMSKSYIKFFFVFLVLSASLKPALSKPRLKKSANTNQLLMADKLNSAQGMVKALVLSDYKEMERLAKNLLEISKATTWHKIDDADFLVSAKSFQSAAQNLIDRAKEKNFDGLALGYMRLQFSCLQCHRRNRHVK